MNLNDGIWIEGEFVPFEQLPAFVDEEQLPQFIKPVGGFCFPAASFMRMPLDNVPFYVDKWLPKQGRLQIHGQAKAGKTFLATHLAACIGEGKPFLGKPTEQGRVLMLQFEVGAEILQQRMIKTGQPFDDVFVGVTFGMKLDTPQGQDMLLGAIEEIKPAVVILDPLYKAVSGDENETKDMRNVLDFLDETIESQGCSYVVMHHEGKDSSRGGRGASVLEDWFDTVVALSRVNKDGHEKTVTKVRETMMRHGVPDDPIIVEMDERGNFVMSSAPSDIYTKMAERILDPLAPMEWDFDFVADIGSRKSIYNNLERLQEQGIIEKVGRGLYRRIGQDEITSSM